MDSTPVYGSLRARSAKRLVLVVVTLLLALAAAPGVASAGPGAGISKLRVGGALGAENYLYTAGDSVFASGSVDAGSYYRFVVTDPGAVAHSTSACAAAPASQGGEQKLRRPGRRPCVDVDRVALPAPAVRNCRLRRRSGEELLPVLRRRLGDRVHRFEPHDCEARLHRRPGGVCQRPGRRQGEGERDERRGHRLVDARGSFPRPPLPARTPAAATGPIRLRAASSRPAPVRWERAATSSTARTSSLRAMRGTGSRTTRRGRAPTSAAATRASGASSSSATTRTSSRSPSSRSTRLRRTRVSREVRPGRPTPLRRP